MRRLLVPACVGVVAIQWIVIALRRATHIGDFDVSREFGRRFLAGENLYAGGLHYPYMPSAAMYFSPLALVAPGVGIALRYAAAIACLWLTLHWLHAMVRGRSAAVATNGLVIGALTVLLASHYIIRDLDDGGPHLILLAMLVGGMFLASKGRATLAGVWFGLATALKAPAALFVPFFIWKRQWRLAAATVIATACWIALPAVWMGPANWWAHQRQWTRVAVGSVVGERAPVAEASELRVQNQALRPALLHFNAHSVTAERVATLAMIGLLAVCGLWARSRDRSGADPHWLVECSAVLILALLGSPVTWVQHMVWMIPALYLIVAEDRGFRRFDAPVRAALMAYVVFALVLNRELLGRETYLLLLSLHTQTLCMLLVLGIIVVRRPTGGA